MKQERVILSFVMVLIGLLVAGTAFYFYQSSKKSSTNTQTIISPTPTTTVTTEKIFLTINNPANESVVNKKAITLSGKTNPNATVIIITKADQQVLNSNDNGVFSANLTLDNDQNLITVISVLPTGENKQIQHIITYSTSNF